MLTCCFRSISRSDSHVIYASQCAHFPQIDSPNELSRSVSSSASTFSSMTSNSSTVSSILSSWSQEKGDAAGAGPSTSKRSQDSARNPDSSGDILMDEEVEKEREQEQQEEIGPLPDLIDLPVIQITVPYPSQMPVLHTWLYVQNPEQLLSYFLSLSSTNSSSPYPSGRLIQRLGELTVQEILARLKKIHAVWQNVVSLGMGDEKLWKAMHTGWAVLVGALKAKGGREMEKEDGGRTVGVEVNVRG